MPAELFKFEASREETAEQVDWIRSDSIHPRVLVTPIFLVCDDRILLLKDSHKIPRVPSKTYRSDLVYESQGYSHSGSKSNHRDVDSQLFANGRYKPIENLAATYLVSSVFEGLRKEHIKDAETIGVWSAWGSDRYTATDKLRVGPAAISAIPFEIKSIPVKVELYGIPEITLDEKYAKDRRIDPTKPFSWVPISGVPDLVDMTALLDSPRFNPTQNIKSIAGWLASQAA